MNPTKLLTSILIIALLLFSIAYVIPPAHALPSVNLASMPSCGSSVSQSVYDSGTIVWQVCYLNGVLWKEDFSTSPATMTSYATGGVMVSANPIGLVQDSSNLYATGRVSGQVFKIPKSAPATVSVLASGLTGDILYPTILSGFLYVPYGNGVAKIDVTSGATTLITTGNQMTACSNDGALIFCTSSTTGKLYEINPSTNTATLRVSGLSTPLGLYITASFVYVAQDVAGGTVAQISRSTWTTLLSGTVSSGTNDKPYWVTQIGIYLVVSTEGTGAVSGNRNIYVYNPTTMAGLAVILSPVVESGQVRPLFALASDGTNIFAAFQGSSGTGEITNWQASVPASTTTTSSSSTTSTTSAVTTITVTSSSSSSTSSSSTVSTNECGGSIGAMCQYPQQVIPTITFNSTGLGGQHNIYLTHNGTQRVGGFEWFALGGSSGDFLFYQFISLLGCCGWESSPSPSNGTFANVAYSTYNLVPVNGAYSFQPVYQPQPSTLVVGQTHYGWLCDDGHIAKNFLGCDGGIPISYRTFSANIVVSVGRNVITFQAIGTQSGTQISQQNIIIDYKQD